jgi:UDPglucose 6-dehydrogenase
LKKVDALIKQEFQLAHHHQPLPKFFIASAPEFLKEGSAVQDTLRPDRVVLGTNDASAERVLRELHAPFNAPVVSVAPESAQMAKYAANAYLATRITFINQIADLCERNGANVQEVIEAIGYDRRIGHHYWYPGLGYGGSCFPKDVKELAAYSRAIGESNNLFVKINELNDARIWRILDKVGQTARGWQGKHVAVLGLSFKPNTDDLREAPSTKIIPYLTSHGARITGYDPKATYQPSPQEQAAFVQKESIEATVADADVILAVVEWPEIVGFDFGNTKAQKPQWFIDARNQFDATTLRKTGYHYIGIGQTT